MFLDIFKRSNNIQIKIMNNNKTLWSFYLKCLNYPIHLNKIIINKYKIYQKFNYKMLISITNLTLIISKLLLIIISWINIINCEQKKIKILMVFL